MISSSAILTCFCKSEKDKICTFLSLAIILLDEISTPFSAEGLSRLSSIDDKRDKPNVEGVVGFISTWIIAALRNEQYFSLSEINTAIRNKLNEFNQKDFQKKEGSRVSLYRNEEIQFLLPLPTTSYELAVWKQATIQFNYHISVDGMLYSAPHQYIKKTVEVRVTDTIIEIFYNHNRIASHKRLYGRKGQYSTIIDHMPPDHQRYLEWNGNRFRKWAKQIGPNTSLVVNALLVAQRVEQQAYRGCMGLLKMSERYSEQRLEVACGKALSFTASPSYKIVKNILVTMNEKTLSPPEAAPEKDKKSYGITRGATYYGGGKDD